MKILEARPVLGGLGSITREDATYRLNAIEAGLGHTYAAYAADTRMRVSELRAQVINAGGVVSELVEREIARLESAVWWETVVPVPGASFSRKHYAFGVGGVVLAGAAGYSIWRAFR